MKGLKTFLIQGRLLFAG